MTYSGLCADKDIFGGLWWVVVGCFISGILAHRLFCVRTTIDKLFFSEK